jgi:hypothetical protein
VPELVIRIKKNPDGSASLTCTRADGSATWQRQKGQLGAIFPLHDLTHYAVETALGYTNAFYGLVADGWNLSDFTSPWPRGAPPMEARQVENLVSGFEMESRHGGAMNADDYNAGVTERLDAAAAVPGSKVPPQRRLTDDEVSSVRALRAELIARWTAVRPGEAMELEFDRGSFATSA